MFWNVTYWTCVKLNLAFFFTPAVGWKMMSLMLMHLQPVENGHLVPVCEELFLIELREMNSLESQSSWRRGGSFISPLTNNHGFIRVERWRHWPSIIFHVCSMFRQSCCQAELVHVYGFSSFFINFFYVWCWYKLLVLFNTFLISKIWCMKCIM